MEPGLAQFDGTWHAEANTTGSNCLSITEFECEISNGDLSCLGGVVQGTVDSSGSVVGVIHLGGGSGWGNSMGPSRMGAGKAQ